ncbi:MAG: hypothetical protein WB869_20905 [Candidatus Acidiferrales bacterium]
MTNILVIYGIGNWFAQYTVPHDPLTERTGGTLIIGTSGLGKALGVLLGNEPVLCGVCMGVVFSGFVAILTFVAHHKLPYRRMLVLTRVLLGVVLVVMASTASSLVRHL